MVYGLLRALPGARALWPPSSARLSANLTPASGCQDHTTSPSASGALVRSTIRVHRIPPRARDDRETPLKWDGTAEQIRLIWVGGQAGFTNFGTKFPKFSTHRHHRASAFARASADQHLKTRRSFSVDG